MKLLTSVLLIATICFTSAYAEELPDTHENRMAAAERYVSVTPTNIMDEMIQKMSVNLPDDKRTDFIEYIKNSAKAADIQRITVESLAKHMNTNELTALADFYSTPVGRSISEKMPDVMADVMPAMVQELRRTIGDYLKKLQ